MRNDRFAERHSFNVLGFIQLLYDTTCLNLELWVKLVLGLGCSMSWRFIRAQFHFPHSSLVAAEKRSEIWVICREGSYDVMAAISIKQYFFLHLIRQHNFVYVSFFSKSRILKYFIGIQSCLAKRNIIHKT